MAEIPIDKDFTENTEYQGALIQYYWHLIHSYMYYCQLEKEREAFMFWSFLSELSRLPTGISKDYFQLRKDALDISNKQYKANIEFSLNLERKNRIINKAKESLCEVYNMPTNEYEIYQQVIHLKTNNLSSPNETLQKEINTAWEIVRLFIGINQNHYKIGKKYASMALVERIFNRTKKSLIKKYRAGNEKELRPIFNKYQHVLHLVGAWALISSKNGQEKFKNLSQPQHLCLYLLLAHEIGNLLNSYKKPNALNKKLVSNLLTIPAHIVQIARNNIPDFSITNIIRPLDESELEAYTSYRNRTKTS